MNAYMLAQHLKIVQTDLKEIHETVCLGCAHIAADRASQMTRALIAILEAEQRPVYQMQIFALPENEEKKA